MLKLQANRPNSLALLKVAVASIVLAITATAAQAVVLDEIVVTAQKREQNLQEVPISITQFGGAEINKLGANDLRDLDGFIPNVIQTGLNSGLEPSISIRGISSETRNSGFDSGASMYVDGVFMGRPSAFFSNLSNVESLEVLRGPQGTLFGKNTIAGAFNVRTYKPGDELQGGLELRAGNYDFSYIRAALSGAVVKDSLYAGINIFNLQRDGLQDNIGTGGEQGDKDEYGWQGKLRYVSPSENLEVIFAADDFKDDSRQPIFVVTNGLGSDCCGGDLYTVSTNIEPSVERDISGQSLTLNYDLQSGATFTSISALRNNDIGFIGDTEGTTLDFLSTDFDDSEDQFSQEFRYASSQENSLRYVLGLYYFDQDVTSDRKAFAGADFVAFLGLPPFVVIPPITMMGEIETQAYAVFGHADYDISDNLVLTLGLRYTNEERQLTRFDLSGEGATVGTFGLEQVVEDKVDDDAVSWTLGLSYQFSDSATAYVKVSEGFKSGGFNLEFVGLNDFTLDFDPEFATTYEAGIKSEWYDKRLRINAALFYTDYEDLQVSRLVNIGPLGSFRIDNAAEAEIQGFELEIQALPTESLMLSATLGYLDTEFTDFEEGTTDFSGNEFASAPEVSFSLVAEYTHDLGDLGSLFIRGEYTYRDDYFDDPENDILQRVDSNDLTNARIGFRSADEHWTVEVYGRNLADEEYITAYSNPPTGLGVNVGEQRTYGVRVVYDL